MKAHKYGYDPYAIRRCVRIQDVAADGIVVFRSKSFTRHSRMDRYHPTVDLETGAVSCNCPDFHYRLAKTNPTTDGANTCKHLGRALANLRRRGLIRRPGEVQYETAPLPF